METPEIGDRAPDIEVRNTLGQTVRLSEYWCEQPVILAFLRHFGCSMCRAFLAELRQIHPNLEEAGVQVLAMTMGQPEQTDEFCTQHEIDFVCLSDPERISYGAYG